MSVFDKLLKSASDGDILKQIADGFFGSDFQKDYAHASKLFRPNGLALAPKHKFLFHVFFTLSPGIEPIHPDAGLIGALVKSIQLPSFNLETEEYIQYNRKRLVHNRIKYDPINIKLHDDGMNVINQMWQAYYKYYFADSNYEYDSGISPGGKTDYNGRDIYDPSRPNQSAGWGKTVANGQSNGQKSAFFKDIKIFGLNRGNYVGYTLINPVITRWQGDTYDYAAGSEVMEYSMDVQYEAVKYDGGLIGEETVKGFAKESRYDTEAGALGPGSTRSLEGQGGLTDTFTAVQEDLANGNFAGAIQKAGASVKTFGSLDNLTNVITTDLFEKGRTIGLSALGDGVKALNFPTQNKSSNSPQKASPKKVDDN